METTQLKKIALSAEMMDASQISAYVANAINATKKCTQFEVLINKTEIPAWSKDTNDKSDPTSIASILDFDNTTATGETYTYAVPIEDIHWTELKCEMPKEECDVVIDWGDGTPALVCKTATIDSTGTTSDLLSYSDEGSGEWRIRAQHTYAQNGKYIVSIYGNTVWGLRNHSAGGTGKNCICRIFDWNLKTSDYLRNISSICHTSNKILKIQANGGYKAPLPRLINCAMAFANCYNLKKVTGMREFFMNTITLGSNNFFLCCYSLEECDLVVPVCTIGNSAASSGNNSTFQECYNLKTAPEKLIPTTGFANATVKRPFYMNHKMTAPVLNSLNDTLVNVSTNFTNGAASWFNTTNMSVLKNIPAKIGGYSDKLVTNTIDDNHYAIYGNVTITSLPTGTIDGVIAGGAKITCTKITSVIFNKQDIGLGTLNSWMSGAPHWIYTPYRLTKIDDDNYQLTVNNFNNVYLNSLASFEFLRKQSGYPWSLSGVNISYKFDSEQMHLGGPLPLRDLNVNPDWNRPITVNKLKLSTVFKLGGIDFFKENFNEITKFEIVISTGSTTVYGTYDIPLTEDYFDISNCTPTKLIFKKTPKELAPTAATNRNYFINIISNNLKSHLRFDVMA